MSKYQFGDIYLVKFHPAVGAELKRYRPALIISSVTNVIDSRFVTIAAISTSINPKNKFEVVLDSYALDKKSATLLWYVRTIDVSRLEVKIGKISDDNKTKCMTVLSKIFR